MTYTSIWQPAHTIKAYPELQGYFNRGENHLLAYLHNWTAQLIRKGKSQNPEWVFLTQQQIAEAIDYSISSVKRFVRQVNQKIEGAIQVRSRQVWVTKFFAYTVWEYRVNWPKVTSFLTLQKASASRSFEVTSKACVARSTDQLETATMAESSHLHFELGGVQNELGVAQNELTYKNQFKDHVKEIKTSPTPPKKINGQSGVNPELEFISPELEPERAGQASVREPSACAEVNSEETLAALSENDLQTTATGIPELIETKSDISEDRSSAAAEKMNIASRSAAALGLICQNRW
jgi:hypothetical protein